MKTLTSRAIPATPEWPNGPICDLTDPTRPSNASNRSRIQPNSARSVANRRSPACNLVTIDPEPTGRQSWTKHPSLRRRVDRPRTVPAVSRTAHDVSASIDRAGRNANSDGYKLRARRSERRSDGLRTRAAGSRAGVPRLRPNALRLLTHGAECRQCKARLRTSPTPVAIRAPRCPERIADHTRAHRRTTRTPHVCSRTLRRASRTSVPRFRTDISPSAGIENGLQTSPRGSMKLTTVAYSSQSKDLPRRND